MAGMGLTAETMKDNWSSGFVLNICRDASSVLLANNRVPNIRSESKIVLSLTSESYILAET